MIHADLLIHLADQPCVIPAHDGGPQRGNNLGDLALIEDGAIAATHRRIVAVGPTVKVREAYTTETVIDANGHVVTPAFFDPLTHALWAGDRANEFEMRVGGASYMEIMASGGGIASTVKATLAASVDQLVEGTLARLDRMLALGSTTVEVKTGYGLDADSEIRALDAILCLDALHPIDLVPTFLGAHAVPPAYKGRTDTYVTQQISEMLPAVQEWARDKRIALPFVDVFSERPSLP